MEMAIQIYGEKTFITNVTTLTYALALSKCEGMQEKSKAQYEKAKNQIAIISSEIEFKEDCNLHFNMLMVYSNDLIDYGCDD